jgi:hypothetical protein
MSLCQVCHLDSKKHSKKLWTLHQQTQKCVFCEKRANEHSEELWKIHKRAVEKGSYCGEHHEYEKLSPITVGLARKGIARVHKCNTVSRGHEIELTPIYMSCTECGFYLGSTEEDYADILGSMCLICFRELIGQTDTFYDTPPVLKGKQCVTCSSNFFNQNDSDKCKKCRKENE